MIPVKAADGLKALQFSLVDPPFQTRTEAIKVPPSAAAGTSTFSQPVSAPRTGRVDGDRVPIADVD